MRLGVLIKNSVHSSYLLASLIQYSGNRGGNQAGAQLNPRWDDLRVSKVEAVSTSRRRL